MEYLKLIEVYEKIESTTKRLEIIDYLTELFKTTPREVIQKVIYLTQGKLYPDFIGIEFGVAEKLLIRALAFASGFSEREIATELKTVGDLGNVAENVIKRKKQRALFTEPLDINKVYTNYERVAKATGGGSQDLKLKLIAELLHDATPLEAKYIIRTVTGKLRLGVADMTLIDALANAFAERSCRDEIERAYNLHPDLGIIGKVLASEGSEGLKKIKLEPGIPARAMLAERLSTAEEILAKLKGYCAFEYKYDGLRIQAHITPDKIWLFSRRLENITKQFPDISRALREAIYNCNSAIVEGECVPVNVHTGELLPFQTVSRRRGRIYDLEKTIEEYPVILFLFDCLFVDGVDYTDQNFKTRRNKLESIVRETDRVKLSKLIYTDNIEAVNNFFNEAMAAGCEGLLAKSVAVDSIYRAGARGWQWIKYKREYKSEMVDTVDLVVVGAFAGHGRRSGLYGALLMAVYNPQRECYETLCKLGSGFTDDMLAKLPEILTPYKIDKCHTKVISNIEADYWFSPAVVMEVLGAEITFSPVHTCAFGKLKSDAGLAIRFPRFTGNWRFDKSPEQATTTEELIAMYNTQLKHLE